MLTEVAIDGCQQILKSHTLPLGQAYLDGVLGQKLMLRNEKGEFIQILAGCIGMHLSSSYSAGRIPERCGFDTSWG